MSASRAGSLLLKKLMVALVFGGFTLLTGEFVIRFVAPQRGAMGWIRNDSRYDFVNKADYEQDYPFTKRFTMKVRTNKMGFRDNGYDPDAIGSTRNILLVGDSYTFGYGVNIEDTFGWRLQQKLLAEVSTNIAVINAGVLGWGTEQEARFALDHLAKIRPEAIVLTFCPNDIEDDKRFRAGGFNIERGFLPDFPGKNFLRLHSHLYRLFYYAYYRFRHGEDLNALKYVETRISHNDWETTLATMNGFARSVESANLETVLLVQSTVPWLPDVRTNLAKLDNGRTVRFVDSYDATVALPAERRHLEFDGHWPAEINAIAASNLFEKLSPVLTRQ